MRRSHPKPDVEPRTGVAGKRRNRLVIRALTVLLAIPLGVLVTAPSLASPTEAAWVVKQAAGAPATAMTVPRATLPVDCRYMPGIVGLAAHIRIYWQAPGGYNLTKAELHVSTAGLGSNLVKLPNYDLAANTTFDAALQRYTSSVPTGLLNGLLGMGSEIEVAIVYRDYGWTSRPASIATNGGLLSLAPTCRRL